MSHIVLTPQDISQIDTLIHNLMARFKSVENPDFLNNAAIYAHQLPQNLRENLYHFKLLEKGDGICVVKNIPLDDVQIGPTPPHWRGRNGLPETLYQEIFMILCSTLLGESIAWSTQQAGYLVHEVAPIREYETEQLGFSSQQNLEWHTEDAFHPYRPDYLGLMCFRNPTQTPTTYCSVDDLDLSHPMYDILFEPHHTIRPDESHLEKNRADEVAMAIGEEVNTQVDYEDIAKMNTAPDKVAVLFGDRRSPYMRLDPYFMNPAENPQARRAFDALVQQVDNNMKEVVLQPGEMVFLDNYRVVHGRPPFVANYDGKDRWLKRINITRDLRKSRDARENAGCRTIQKIGFSHERKLVGSF